MTRAHLGRDLRALGPLLASAVVRILREGLVIRAIVWPGALISLTLLGTAAVVLALGSTPRVAVQSPQVVGPLQAAGFEVVVVDDAARAVQTGAAPRAVWEGPDGWVLGTSVGGRETAQAEAALRDHVQAGWRRRLPATAATPARPEGPTRGMVGLLAVLFTLYAVVVGAGVVVRDRETAVLEAELALPVSGWVHGAARLLAGQGVLVVGLLASLSLLHALVGVPQVGTWALHGGLATAAGAALGVLVVCGLRGSVVFRSAAGEGFSGPLSRALTVATGLFGLGWTLPAVGAWLPVASVLSLAGGHAEPAAPVVAGALVALISVGAAARFGVERG